jgi:hypothetical protein
MRILSTLLILAPLTLLAAEPIKSAVNDVEPPSEYDVELLVFLRDTIPGGEYWPASEELPSPAQAIATVRGETPPEFPPELRSTGDTVQAHSRLGKGPATRIRPLGIDSYQLTAQAEALRRNGMPPLVHAVWRQVVGNRDNQDWLWLENGPLYGLVRISLGRYLHIDTDLALSIADAEDGSQQTVRVRDHRRMRSGELHHIDHPGFGILVQINRYEAPEPVAPPIAEPLMLEPLSTQPQSPVSSEVQ